MQIKSKLPDVGTTIFTEMSVLAQQHAAINLGQGFPDFLMSAELVAFVSEAMQQGYNQYIHMNGYMPLRETLAEKVEYLYKGQINPDTEITVTPGGTYALYTALTTILQPGDEVVILGRQGHESWQQIDAREVAAAIGTIPWEIVCRLGTRIERQYD